MNKREFLNSLKYNLKGLSSEEVKDILFDYEEYFEVGANKGRSEVEIANSLGNPKQLAKQLKATYMIQNAQEKSTTRNLFKAVMACIGLGFFNIIFIMPFLGIVIAVFGVLLCGVAIVIISILVLIISVFMPQYYSDLYIQNTPAINIFLCIGLACLGYLISVGSYSLIKLFYRVSLKYLKLNLKIITGNE
ncbi:DUF1700 domain-containing protein [Clostridiaceae bacterium M8S5]|nr:DUF1700 domain-containing protein [Clostridiaceae bacterium M8S5]